MSKENRQNLHSANNKYNVHVWRGRYLYGVWAFGDASLPIWVIAHVPFLWAMAANRCLLTSNIML